METSIAPPLGQWLELSWNRYKERLWEQLTIGGLGSAAGLVGALVPAAALVPVWLARGGVPRWGWIAAGTASLSAALWIMSWAQAAMTEAALSAERLGVRRAYALAWPKTPGFSWVCILWFLALVGGLLFLVPALVLGVSLAFAPFVCVAESKAGLSALEGSFACVRGRWWAVLGRLAIVGLLLTAAAAVPIVGWILSALAAPFALIAAAVLYEDLKRTTPPHADAGALRSWLLACGAGLVGLFVMGASAVRTIMSLDQGAWAGLMQNLIDNPQDGSGLRKLTDALQQGREP